MTVPAKPVRTFEARTARQWRAWLAAHHESESEVWLVFNKRHTGRASISYEDAVDEALCFGWIDSLIKRIDESRYLRKFTPRRPDSRWSTANRKRYARLQAAGRLMPAGTNRAPTARSGDAPRPLLTNIPRDIQHALKSQPAAWRYFESLAPSYRRLYVAWIDSAKQEATRTRRLREVVDRLSAGRKPGLK